MRSWTQCKGTAGALAALLLAAVGVWLALGTAVARAEQGTTVDESSQAEGPVGEEEGSPPPVEVGLPAVSDGDITFHLDCAAFQGEAEKTRVEFFVSIPNEQVNFEEEDGDFHGRVRFAVELEDEDGNALASSDREYPLAAGTLRRAKDRAIVQVLTESLEVPPGDYHVHAEVEDVTRLKTGLWYRLRKIRPLGSVDRDIVIPDLVPQPIALSDIEFVRSVQETDEESPYNKAGLDVIPNPSRMYGFFLPMLMAYLEVYATVSPADSDAALATVYRITGGADQVLFEERKPGIPATLPRWAKTIRLDISSLPAGQYNLEVDIEDAAGEVLAGRSEHFQVAWSVYAWGREMDEILQEMEILLSKDEYERLTHMRRGEAEKFLEAFWKDLDPTPGTPLNEALQEHFRRVAYADRRFTVAGHPGIETDRGRLYVRYGEPDEIEEGYSDEFVLDSADRDVSLLTGPGPAGSTADEQTDRLLDRRTREGLDRALRAGGGSIEAKRYEVWYYDSRSGNLTGQAHSVGRNPRMRFVFVDQDGYGDLRLVYSSEPGQY